MRTQLLNELKLRKQELEKELLAIDTILRSNEIIIENINSSNSSTEEIYVGTPKGDRSWVEYTLFILKEIGGRGKVVDLVEKAKGANTKYSQERLKQAFRHHLSILYRSGKIGANESRIKSKGNEYFLIE